MKVLYISSNPDHAATLHLEGEITKLQRGAIESSGEPVRFIFMPDLPFEDLPSAISDHKPDVVHISAHGSDGSLALAHGGGKEVLLTAEMLCTFLDVEPVPRILYLNACNSASVAKDVVARVPMAIGTTAPVSNRAAIMAALNFYIRLLEGKSVQSAFDTGRMIMEGLADRSVSSEIFCHPSCDARTQIMHVATRIMARFWKDKPQPKNGENYDIELGIVGCPRNTTQVVFFTDDETFIGDDISLESYLCSVIRSTVVRGEVWTGDPWQTHADFRIFASGITPGGDINSAMGMLCVALETYYLAHFQVSTVAELPDEFRQAIADLRLRDGASVVARAIADLPNASRKIGKSKVTKPKRR